MVLYLSLHCVYSLWEISILLRLLDGLLGGLLLGQSSADGSGLLDSQVNWNKFLVGELLSQLQLKGII